MIRPPVLEAVRSALDSPQVVQATTIAIIGTGFMADTIQRLLGWPGLIAVVGCLTVLSVATLLTRWRTLGHFGALPTSLLILLAWVSVSLIWSSYRWATVAGLAYLFAFTILGLYVGLLRDSIQIVRSFGSVLRFILGLSLGLEIVSGILLDTPLKFLGIEGNLSKLGPIQGVVSTRNQLALVAIIALVTFSIEWLTRSVTRGVALGSVIVGALCLIFSRSPVGLGVVAAVALAVLALYLIRRAPPQQRALWQWGTLGAAMVLAVVAALARGTLIVLLSANSELAYRLSLWGGLWDLIAVNPLQGWGWIGAWRSDLQPFTFFATAREPTSAVNAYIDVWFQLGLVGLFVFLVLLGLAFTRSWLLAGRRRSIMFAWPALILVVLLISSLAESSILVDYGWLTFVVCCVKAANELSWRRAFARVGSDDDPVGSENPVRPL